MTTLAIIQGRSHSESGMMRLIRTLSRTLSKKDISLDGATIACLGHADQSGGASLISRGIDELLELLVDRGALVRVYDPRAPKRSTVGSLREALTGADAAMILSPRSSFETLNPLLLQGSGVVVVLDGCYCLSPDEFEDSDILYTKA